MTDTGVHAADGGSSDEPVDAPHQPSDGPVDPSHDHADGSAEESPERDDGSSFLGLLRESALVLVIALGLSLLIKTFLAQAFFIPSESMENTLLVGDRVLVSKLTPGPFDLRRGDVVVFADSAHWLGAPERTPDTGVREVVHDGLVFLGLLPADSDEHLVKRLIGLPGDKVTCCDPQGRMSVNGVPLTEPYVYSGDEPSQMPFSVTVPAGRVWVMGDHRSDSLDSRFHRGDPGGGTIAVSDVVGRTFVRLWPLDRVGLVHTPSPVFAAVPGP